jgi:hypothetical protein
MGLGGDSPSFRTSREVVSAIGAEALEDVARDRDGAARISESLATVGSWEWGAALELVGLLFGDVPITCFGWFCGDSDTDGVNDACVIPDDGNEFDECPEFFPNSLVAGRGGGKSKSFLRLRSDEYVCPTEL